ncbi:MAG: choice-of-anchor J domain-containing protein [Mangrovibacterium sp.]|nr:choice-of-anchor J domain-containing protein [Mangrovibacterium sp.]
MMNSIHFHIRHGKAVKALFLIIIALLWACREDDLIFTVRSKQVLFTYQGDSLYLQGGVGVNQLALLEVNILAKDIKSSAAPASVKVSSIPNDGSGPLDEIPLGQPDQSGKFTASMPELGIVSPGHVATLKFVSTFADGEEVIRTFQVRPVSPFEYTAPPSVFALIDNVAPVPYTISAGGNPVNDVKVQKKVNNGTAVEVEGDWSATGAIPVQGKDYAVGDIVSFRIEATSDHATATSEWIDIPVLKPEGQYTYLFEIFFGGTPGAGFTDGCWSGVHGGKSFLNTVFNYEGASGGTGNFNDHGWNTSLTHIVGNTPVVAYSDLVAANFSSTVAAGSTQDLLTPPFNASVTKNNKLEFYYYCQASGDKVNHLKVFITTDNTNWTEIADLGAQPGWTKQVFDLQPDVVRVKFRGISGGAGNVKYNTYVDDIKVYGEF